MTMKSELTATDASSRCPLLLLLVSGLTWLVVSGVLATVASVQLHSPWFLSRWSFTTYGRVTVLSETAFV
jgi:hypothetical protein